MIVDEYYNNYYYKFVEGVDYYLGIKYGVVLWKYEYEYNVFCE